MSSQSDRLVLVVGNSRDPHIQQVVCHLSRCGMPSFILDPSSGEASFSIDFRPAGGAKLLGRDACGKTLSLNSVTAVWWRLKPAVDQQADGKDRSPSDFSTREWRHTLESLEVMLEHATWMNPRAVDRRVRYKPTQLLLARQAGFEIPETLVSNDPTAVADFLDGHEGRGIYKPLTWYFEPPDKILFTNPITGGFITRNRASLERAPGIFQPRIPKAFELRITIVGDAIFPVRIYSQSDEGARLDWRRKQLDLTYEPYQLAPEFHDRLLRFHRSLGLVYGAYDFIVTPDERVVFLEVNPAGQWLWIEERTVCPISRAVAQALL